MARPLCHTDIEQCEPILQRLQKKAAKNLWVAELGAGRNEVVLPGFSITDYAISLDGKRVGFVALDAEGKASIWEASLDRRFAPRQLARGGRRKWAITFATLL